MLEINQDELGKILHLFPGRDHNMSLQAVAVPSSATARRAGFEKVMDYKCILLEK